MPRTARKDRIAPVLCAALELSKSTWVIALGRSDGGKKLHRRVDARDLAAVDATFTWAKRVLALPASAEIVTCYEAGRDGFWLARYFASRGIENRVLDPASIEVPRRGRNVKTDRVDSTKLLSLLVRLENGDDAAAKIVRVPTPEQEDNRVTSRERETIMKERTSITNRISSLLITHGIEAEGARINAKELEQLRVFSGDALPPMTHDCLVRLVERRDFLNKQILAVKKKLNEDFAIAKCKAIKRDSKAEDSACLDDKCAAMAEQLKAIGVTSAVVLSRELFWRDFQSQREVGGYTGLWSVPRQSGGMDQNRGVSRAGNRRVRRVLVELAWRWVAWQPDSKLTKWFDDFSRNKKKMRKVAIVALARKLAIALWRYVKFGVMPEGAVLKPA